MDTTNDNAERSASCSGSTASHYAEAVQVHRVESADGIVDGNYIGEWSGYQVRFETPFGRYVAEMDKGIRGTAKCIVRVLRARITAEIRKGQ